MTTVVCLQDSQIVQLLVSLVKTYVEALLLKKCGKHESNTGYEQINVLVVGFNPSEKY